MTMPASARQVALDVETTGLAASSGHRIIELGCVEIVGGAVTGRVLHRYVDPERGIDAGARRVHGIDRERLRGEPKFAEILDELLDFVRDAEVLIHNAPFDLRFLDAELRRAGRAEPFRECCRQVTDTLPMARRLFPDGGRRLDDLCDRLGVDRSERAWHGALLDAQLLAQVYLRMTGGRPSPGSRARAEPRRAARPDGAEPRREEITAQLSYAKATGSPEDAYPATADELFKLHWGFAEKVRDAEPDAGFDWVQATAMAMAKETVEEMAAAGLALAPTAGALEQYEKRVSDYVQRVQENERQREVLRRGRPTPRRAAVLLVVLLVFAGCLFAFPAQTVGIVLLLLLVGLLAGLFMSGASALSLSGAGPGGSRAGAESRRAASYARTLVRRTKSRK